MATVAEGAEPWVKRLDWKRHYTVRAMLDGSDCDWVVATEGDVLITNLTTPLSTFVDEANTKLGRHASLIVNRDTFGNVNTGTYFVRRSEDGRRFFWIGYRRFGTKTAPTNASLTGCRSLCVVRCLRGLLARTRCYTDQRRRVTRRPCRAVVVWLTGFSLPSSW